jgi:hypothetical protein
MPSFDQPAAISEHLALAAREAGEAGVRVRDGAEACCPWRHRLRHVLRA